MIKHINFDLSGMICSLIIYSRIWYVLSIWNDMFNVSSGDDMFCLSGMICFVSSGLIEHINPDRQNISIWNDMFCLSGMICHVYLEWYVHVYLEWYVLSGMISCPGMICFVYLEWYVLSIWNDMFCLSWYVLSYLERLIFCLSGMICFVYLEWYVLSLIHSV